MEGSNSGNRVAPGGHSSICLGDEVSMFNKDKLDGGQAKKVASPTDAAAGSRKASDAAGMSSNTFASNRHQNCGNVITNRPATRLHAPPGGASSICLGVDDSNEATAEKMCVEAIKEDEDKFQEEKEKEEEEEEEETDEDEKRDRPPPGGVTSVCLGTDEHSFPANDEHKGEVTVPQKLEVTQREPHSYDPPGGKSTVILGTRKEVIVSTTQEATAQVVKGLSKNKSKEKEDVKMIGTPSKAKKREEPCGGHGIADDVEMKSASVSPEKKARAEPSAKEDPITSSGKTTRVPPGGQSSVIFG